MCHKKIHTLFCFMNETILQLIKEYPTDGTHKYHWVNGFDGVTRDLLYKGETIAKKEEQLRTYCCGISFELFFRTALKEEIDLGTPKDVRKIKADWFVATGKRQGPVDALVPRGLGLNPAQGQPGDFAQLWRKNGSGHSVIVLEHTKDHLKYFSTQPSTNGIGVRVEFFKNVKNPIIELFIARLINK